MWSTYLKLEEYHFWEALLSKKLTDFIANAEPNSGESSDMGLKEISLKNHANRPLSICEMFVGMTSNRKLQWKAGPCKFLSESYLYTKICNDSVNKLEFLRKAIITKEKEKVC